ncbi:MULTISPECIES: bifunctional methylenetetrahydrofolate dehydrogenase/methenyltetrahydrofolate cyclohydrolase FolD [Bacillus]|uniref:bifunctional methylenetetrahydrofolate dehydrogenase/methenyltetrahydrofolate cyclohydrolase FolD n=1 Tax=Bacillus TaxID=1386 RepID=UPI0002E5C72C|nr:MULTISPECIES: bifunctional methylenetetrahydrofolate dehydrogenase/methenyltetrahydrofolate cyclohydrolase FolD [Bacillus]
MAGIIIDGTEISKKVREEIAKEVVELKEKGLTPGLAVILVGDNQASKTYVASKEKACQQLGMHSVLLKLPETVTQEELLERIQELNEDQSIHGILVQLPLPKHIDENQVIESIVPEKDVDGFHPVNIGKLLTGQDTLYPCTPYGVMMMLDYIGCNPAGKHAVVVGRSNIVGKPAGQLLLNKNATVTYCHSKTVDMEKFTKDADILVVAVGKRNVITKEHVKPGAVVIDVGMNRDEAGKLCGDVAFDEVKEVASYITPVPKGVGPMTITMLMHNTVKAAKSIHSLI